MSEPTLYRDLGCRHLRVCDSAVPVEIDWPALWGVRSILSWESQPERVQEAFRWATLRALGIGGVDAQ